MDHHGRIGRAHLRLDRCQNLLLHNIVCRFVDVDRAGPRAVGATGDPDPPQVGSRRYGDLGTGVRRETG